MSQEGWESKTDPFPKDLSLMICAAIISDFFLVGFFIIVIKPQNILENVEHAKLFVCL